MHVEAGVVVCSSVRVNGAGSVKVNNAHCVRLR